MCICILFCLSTVRFEKWCATKNDGLSSPIRFRFIQYLTFGCCICNVQTYRSNSWVFLTHLGRKSIEGCKSTHFPLSTYHQVFLRSNFLRSFSGGGLILWLWPTTHRVSITVFSWIQDWTGRHPASKRSNLLDFTSSYPESSRVDCLLKSLPIKRKALPDKKGGFPDATIWFLSRLWQSERPFSLRL